MADATRLRVMAVLIDGEQDVTALTAAVGAARPAVSQHLGKLRLGPGHGAPRRAARMLRGRGPACAAAGHRVVADG
jgi:DNA-binding transcriptional ArsR family regulator